MDQIGNYVLYVIMFCAVLGAFAAIRDSEKGLGKEFMEGIHATGHIMLAGAFPMVYLLRKYLAGPLEALGSKVGLSAVGSAGMLATIANILAMFRLVRFMPPKDKALNIAFGVCAAFLLVDHLSFTANFQPTIILPVLIGKILAGFSAVALAYWLSVPKALQLEQQDRAAGIIDADEYPSSELHGSALPISKEAAQA